MAPKILGFYHFSSPVIVITFGERSYENMIKLRMFRWEYLLHYLGEP